MLLNEWFEDKPRGYKRRFAEEIGVSPVFLSLMLTGRSKIPFYVAQKIEKATKKAVKKKDLRPDIWDK